MRRAYDRAFAPPAPVIPVRFRTLESDLPLELAAKLDSGADLSGVPRDVIERASIPPIRPVRVAGFAGELVDVLVYRVDLEIGGTWIEDVECIATRRSYVIVGRNVLAGFVLKLDGPRAMLDLRR